MRKEDLKRGIWFRRHLHELAITADEATYLREDAHNYLLLRMNDRAMYIPKDSINVVCDESGEIKTIHMRTGYRQYDGLSMDDLDYPEVKMHDMVYSLASQEGKFLDREIYDHYSIIENAKMLPVIEFYHHGNSGWIYYKADKIKPNIKEKSDDFKVGFDFAITQARIWVEDVIAEPGTKILNAETGEICTVE